MADAPTADQFFGAQPLPTADEFFAPQQPVQSGHAWDSIWNTTQTALGKVWNSFANVLGEFGEAGASALDPDTLGIDQATKDYLHAQGRWNDYSTANNAFMSAYNEAVLRPSIIAGQLAYRAPSVLLAGAAAIPGETGRQIEQAIPGRAGAAIAAPFRGAAELIESGPIALGAGLGGAPPLPEAAAAETELATAEARQVADAQAARSAAVIGEGDAGFYDAHPITPENLSARSNAAQAAAVEMPEPLPPAPDIHELARRVDPDTVNAWDTLEATRATERETLQRLSDEREQSPEVADARNAVHEILGYQPDEPIGVTIAREDAFRASAPEPEVVKLDAAFAHLDNLLDTDTPEMTAARDRLMQADLAMRDLAPSLNAAYRQANDMAPDLPLKPEEGVKPSPEAAAAVGATKEGEAAVEPPSVTGGEKLGVPREIGPPAGREAETMVPEQAAAADREAAPPGTAGELEDIAGTGELKTRGAARSLAEKAAADRLATEFGSLPEYRTLNFADQAAQVTKLIADDYERAKAIAMGYAPTPPGLVPSIVWSEVANHAGNIGDLETVNRLAHSRIITGGTAAGRYSAGFARLNSESPVSKIQEVVAARTAELAKTVDVDKAQRDTVAEIKAEMKASATKADRWKSFLEQIEC